MYLGNMTDSKENPSQPKSSSEDSQEKELKVPQKPKRGQSRAIPQAKDKKKHRYNF